MNGAIIGCTINSGSRKVTVVHGAISAYGEQQDGQMWVSLFGESEQPSLILSTPGYAAFDAWYQRESEWGKTND